MFVAWLPSDDDICVARILATMKNTSPWLPSDKCCSGRFIILSDDFWINVRRLEVQATRMKRQSQATTFRSLGGPSDVKSAEATTFSRRLDLDLE